MLYQFKIKVKAGRHDRRQCPVFFRIPPQLPLAPGSQCRVLSMKQENGELTLAQMLREGEGHVLWWIIEELPANEVVMYTVTVQQSNGGEQAEAYDLVGVSLSDDQHKTDVRIDGQFATSFVFDPDLAKPYIGPIAGPYGDSYTRLDFDTKEHPHHRSIWLGIGDINGIDMWNEPEGKFGKQTVQETIDKLSGPVLGRLTTRQVWTSFEGKPQLDEVRSVTVYRTPANARFIDLEFSLIASYGRVEIGATKEAGPLGVRVAESMKAALGGTIVNAYGSIGESECWGKRAGWCDYYGNVNDKVLGIATFDHPSNENFPAYWHVRNYGLMAPNNFYFAGGRLLQKGQTIRYKYRIYCHEGSANEAKVAERYQDYLNPPTTEWIETVDQGNE